MSSVTEYLSQLQTLTKKNLEILQAINEAFFTKQNHLQVAVGDANYVIPSFISLENKINILEENFNNLIHSPSTGEAYFHIDGNTKSISLNSYSYAPNSITLNEVKDFKVYQNDIFKDFLTPVPYVNFNLSSLPNDITSVNVKKIIPKHPDLIELFKQLLIKKDGDNVTNLISTQYLYSDVYKILSIYEEDKDYVDYDTVMKLPIRKIDGNSLYIIESIKSDVINDDLNNYITIKLKSDSNDPQYNNSLTYKVFNDTIEKPLSIGDKLITFDGTGKMEVVEIQQSNNILVVKVLNGDFLNLIGVDQYDSSKGISDLSKLRFFNDNVFEDYKNINIPLEEDEYLFIAVAPLNDRMNIQSSWGSGVVLDTYMLKDDKGRYFNEYYQENVQNIGDTLFEITSMMSNTLTKYDENEFSKMSSIKPVINLDDISVLHINKHLNNSTTVKNIRSLYSQKKRYNNELTEVQTKIDEVNKQLATISFDDAYNLRAGYVAQLTEYNNKKNELVASITRVINEISTNVNDAEIPIENAKYRIRGFFDYDEFINQSGLQFLKNHICGIKVQYRYKTVNSDQGTAVSMTKGFIFSDWNNMSSFDIKKEPHYDNGYKFQLPGNNNKENEPSFNQIDIPISQGETVDIRLKVVYDFGAPFVETTSQWSDIVNVKFPDEFLKDVKILDIISENNNDIETNRFLNIIAGEGIPNHINDKLIDQDKTYHHNPDNIASGFYTAERRVIPLKDKLLTMDNILTRLQDEILGSSTDSLTIVISNGNVINNIYPWQVNNVSVQPYDIFSSSTSDKNALISEGVYNYEKGIVSTILNITITNTSNHTVKLYSMFPGNRDVELGNLVNSKFTLTDYTVANDDKNKDKFDSRAVWLCNQSYDIWGKDETDDKNKIYRLNTQTCNQFITFRINDINTGTPYYVKGAQWSSDQLSLDSNYIIMSDLSEGELSNIKKGAALYPYIKNSKSLCVDSDSSNSFITLDPGQELRVPLMLEYKLTEPNSSLSKTISFDLRTSLYNDPVNYIIKVTTKATQTTADKLLNANRDSKYTNTVISNKYNDVVITK